MTVQWCTESLLVEVVADETNAATKHEQTVQGTDLYKVKSDLSRGDYERDTDLDVLVSLIWSEGTAVPEKVNKADSNATIDI